VDKREGECERLQLSPRVPESESIVPEGGEAEEAEEIIKLFRSRSFSLSSLSTPNQIVGSKVNPSTLSASVEPDQRGPCWLLGGNCSDKVRSLGLAKPPLAVNQVGKSGMGGDAYEF